MASKMFMRIFSQPFSNVIKIQSSINLYGVSCGPLSRLRNRQVLRSLSGNGTRSIACHFNPERERPVPKPAPPVFVLGPVFYFLGLATTTAICAGDEDWKSSENKENCSEPPSTPANHNGTRDQNGRFCKRHRKTPATAHLLNGFKAWNAKRKLYFKKCEEDEPLPKRSTRSATAVTEEKPLGTRLVDLDIFRQQIKECKHCHSGPLSIQNLTNELRFGLASEFLVKCTFCGKDNKVKTSQEHRSGTRGPSAFDINTRVALGCLHAGIGNTHLNNILSTMNIPALNCATFKTREREVGKAIETVAKTSCQEYLGLERELAIKNGEVPDGNSLVPVACSYDMGWQKRGRGYNSTTGHAALMSTSSGKVLDYTTRTKACRFCESAKRKGKQPTKHDCRRNHTASSKAMEPDAAVEMFNNAPKSNVKFAVYTGDDDSTTECYIHQKVPYEVEKWSDIIHMKRSLTTRLYNLSQRGKFSDSSILSQKVINYLVKCFSYCVAQNKGNPQAIQATMKCIVPHSFGTHDQCDVSWCGFKQDPLTYKHKDLPYGKDLHGEKLKLALQDLFEEYSTDTVAEKLAPMANSQRNEALNSVVGSKNPKIRFYGGSDSNDFRVACGVAQTNLRYGYISKTLETLNIESGHFSEQYIKKMDHKCFLDKTRKSSLKFKRRRSQLHRQKFSDTARREAREGKTYETGIGLNVSSQTSSFQEEVGVLVDVTTAQLKQFESVVPPYTVKPSAKNQEAHDTNKFYNFIFFDTETNTLGKTAEICQLSATDKSGSHIFSKYILPNQNIDTNASNVNKLRVQTIGGVRKLYKDYKPVESVPVQAAIADFVNYLQATIAAAQSHTSKSVCTVLIGHNATTFDTPVLLRNGGDQFIENLKSMNVSFADSLLLFKRLLKSKEPSLQQTDGSFPKPNQSSLYKCLFNESFDAHDALEDATALRKMVFSSRLRLSEESIVKYCSLVTTSQATDSMKYFDHRHTLLKSLNGRLFNPGPIKKQIAEKIAGSGLAYGDLQTLFKQFGRIGLIAVLSQPPSSSSSNSARATRTPRILTSIVRHFEENTRIPLPNPPR